MAAESKLHDDAGDFSLVLGGALFQLFRKVHLTGDGLELLVRRLVVIPAFAWLPLLVLVVIGLPGSGTTRVAFLRDVEVHVRFLVALPVLIAAEVIAHSRLRPVVRAFVARRIVPPEELPRFQSALDRAGKLRNSVALEVALLVLVYTVGLWIWSHRPALDGATWYARSGGRWHLTPAGVWYVFISIPILQFLLLRWYARLFIWYRFLWHVSRMRLHLIPTHPDRAGGLAFLGSGAYAFGPILFAQGAMFAGVIADLILYRGDALLSFKLQIFGFVAILVVAILGPLTMFSPQLAAARRYGLADYGLLAQRYVEEFEEKWAVPDSAKNLLGSGDIQSLADLGNSYAVIREMRPVPFGIQDIARLAIVAVAPMTPLLLTIWSPEELLTRVLQAIF